MILAPPAPDLLPILNALYGVPAGSSVLPSERTEALLAVVASTQLPVELPPVAICGIESMGRKPHIRSFGSRLVIVHDERFADTVSFLDLFRIGLERPLLSWVTMARAFTELLYFEGSPGLALHLGARVEAYVDQFRTDSGSFLRPMNVAGDVDLSTAIAQLHARKKHVPSVQRALVVFHELGHAAWRLVPAWSDAWRVGGPALLDPRYRADPTGFDQEVGLGPARRLAPAERTRRDEQLVASMVEEIACDSFAMVALAANAERFDLSSVDAVEAFWRFLTYTDLVANLRRQGRLAVKGGGRWRSELTRLFVRATAMLTLLRTPEAFPFSAYHPTAAEAIRSWARLEDAVFDGLLHATRMASHLMTAAIGGPSPWELDDLNAAFPIGFLSGLRPGEMDRRLRVFNDLFGDGFLGLPEEPPHTAVASGCRSAGHMMIRMRMWAAEYRANPSVHGNPRVDAAAPQEAEAALARAFNEVTRDAAEPVFRIRST